MMKQTEAWSAATQGARRLHLGLSPGPVGQPGCARTSRSALAAGWGGKALIDMFQRYAAVGVDHIAVNLRQSARPLPEVLDELASEVIPALNNTKAAIAA